MEDDEHRPENLDDLLRAAAEELGQSVEHMINQFDVEDVAGRFGIDPDRARMWAETAGMWLRSQVERAGSDAGSRANEDHHEPAGRAEPAGHRPHEPAGHRPTEPTSHAHPSTDDPLSSAAPHPLDTPTEEQGTALAALASGRWTVEPGSKALATHGEGPGPSDALGLARELHVRDWISADGLLTPAGFHALDRWLNAAGTKGAHS